MPNWSRPCPIRAEVAPNLGAGGATSFVFDRGEVFGWDMKIQGSEERVLDSVLPHEVTHTIFASYFRQPLPRWADEGACTTVEHVSERDKQKQMLIGFLRTGHGIAFHDMFAMKEYPADVLPLYAQGYSLARFLIDQGGRQKFLDFVGDGMKTENWSDDIKKHYKFENLADLQSQWLEWVKRGSPALDGGRPGEMLAANDKSSPGAGAYRAQSDDRQSAGGGSRISMASANNAIAPSATGSAAADDHGWTSAAGKAGGVAAPAASDNASSADPRWAMGDRAGAAGHASVYDRRPSAIASTAGAPPADPLPFNPAPPSASTGPKDVAGQREPEWLARRDDATMDQSNHRVLLEWKRPN